MNQKQKLALKKKAHHLSTIVSIGNNGLTDAVLSEIDLALNHHELIKIKSTAPKDSLPQIIQTIETTLHAELIQHVGHRLVFFRKKEPSS